MPENAGLRPRADLNTLSHEPGHSSCLQNHRNPRNSATRQGGGSRRFEDFEGFCKSLNHRLFVASHLEWLEQCARRFLEKHDAKQVAYFDELEALSLIVQTPDERVEPKVLVKGDERFPGGKEDVSNISNAAYAAARAQYALFLLCMGDDKPEAPLKELRHELRERAERQIQLDMVARMTPGQGMAVVTVTAEGWRESVTLDFLQMSDSQHTILSLERDMERSFPPDTPHVRADDDLWHGVCPFVDEYLCGARELNGTWFARAAWIYPLNMPLPRNTSPLEQLRRKNVFGNDPDGRLPIQNTLFETFDFKALFKKLARDYNNATDTSTKDQLARLIAWTYQHDFADFKTIRKQCVKKVLAYAKKRGPAPLYQEMSLCANLCVNADEWADLLNAVYYRISDYTNNVDHDFYLLYNLLQFHTDIIEKTSINHPDECWKWVQHFPYWLGVYQYGGVTSMRILKSLLYFLRCRLYDGKKFLTPEHDANHYQIIFDCLQQPVHPNARHVQVAVLRYLNGQGKIDDLLGIDDTQ